jgi:putative antitoxin of VapBC-like toxin-antitoxin system
MSTNVAVDDELLKEALSVTGEPTSSEVVNKALAELVRVTKLRKAFEDLRRNGDPFWPGYLEQIRPNSYAAIEARRKKRLAAKARRDARKSTQPK